MGGLSIEPRAGTLGATVTGVDLNEVDDAAFAQIDQALLDHKVLFFPGQQPLELTAHRDLAARFGEPEVHPYLNKVDEAVPEVVRISEGERADTWHTDVTFAASPPLGSIFQITVCPPVGGDTMWTNMEAAYDVLSAPMQAFLEGLTATHSASLFGKPTETARHPLVRVHPRTGRKALYVNRTWTTHINEVSPAESDALLNLLYAHSEQPQFTVRASWQPGDVAMWDNRSTMHIAVNDYGDHERVLQRVTILGDKPEPVGPLPWTDFVPETVSARTMLPLVKGPRAGQFGWGE